jgi:hypothetical protein
VYPPTIQLPEANILLLFIERYLLGAFDNWDSLDYLRSLVKGNGLSIVFPLVEWNSLTIFCALLVEWDSFRIFCSLVERNGFGIIRTLSLIIALVKGDGLGILSSLLVKWDGLSIFGTLLIEWNGLRILATLIEWDSLSIFTAFGILISFIERNCLGIFSSFLVKWDGLSIFGTLLIEWNGLRIFATLIERDGLSIFGTLFSCYNNQDLNKSSNFSTSTYLVVAHS